MRRIAAALLACLVAAAAPAPAGTPEIERARALLAEAGTALSRASGPAARRAALGTAVRAHEAALAALRSGLRALAAEDRALTQALSGQRQRLSDMLAALQNIARAPRSALVTHPGGMTSAARAGLLLSEMAPRLSDAAARIGRELDALRAVRLNQEIARAEARGALAALQALRADAEEARREGGRSPDTRTALRRQAEEAAARVRDLDGLAAALRVRREADEPPGPGPFAERRGRLVPPVGGQITGNFGGVDPWGRTGRGIAFTAPAYAQVLAPADGTIRYAGPLIDYGEVVILEPESGWLFVFAGLGNSYRRVGETVLAGERLGDLGGPLPTSEEFLLEARGQVPQVRMKKLYVELRRDGTAIDPAPWFGDP